MAKKKSTRVRRVNRAGYVSGTTPGKKRPIRRMKRKK